MHFVRSAIAFLSLGGLTAFAVMTLSSLLAQPQTAYAEATSITISASPIAWNPEAPQEAQAGNLVYVGGLELTSEAPRFGGLSGLAVSPDGAALIAVSDQGDWFTARLEMEGDRPVGLSQALIAPILDAQGDPLESKTESDAEGLAILEGTGVWPGRAIVSFERHHRVDSYDLESNGLDAKAHPVADFGAFAALENNKGLEAVTYLADGSLLAISEETLDADGFIVGARLTTDGAAPVRFRQHVPYALTDVAVLPGGDLVTLERRYSPIGGVGLLMRRIPAGALEKDEPLDGPILLEANNSRSIDNMEGFSVRRAEDGRTLLYLVSDDNFNPLQRTLLLVFALDE
ncbi:MAG: esterase-like activity of phytase family protein [Parvibaculaceae bacterium]